MARPSKYLTNVEPKLTLVEAWARDGLIDEDIAKRLNISLSSFYEYKKEYVEFSDALKKGKEYIDVLVENALLKRALGYEYDEVTYESEKKVNDDTGVVEYVRVETKRVTKEVQPDTTAQIFWLKNRRPKQWRDKQEIEHSGDLKIKLEDYF